MKSTLVSFTSPLPFLADLHASYCFCSVVIFLSLSKLYSFDCQQTIYLAQYQYRPTIKRTSNIMPVPRRRNRKSSSSSGGGIIQFSDIPRTALKLFDATYVFSKMRLVLFYGFMPAVFYIGMTTEPRPQSWWEPFNILE
jgi:hypothetical protein